MLYKLPIDILILIMKYLDFDDIINLEMTCNAMSNYINLYDEYLFTDRYLLNYNQNINLGHVTYLVNRYNYSRFNILKYVHYLEENKYKFYIGPSNSTEILLVRIFNIMNKVINTYGTPVPQDELFYDLNKYIKDNQLLSNIREYKHV